MTTERWTYETLDKFASTVATAITASNERMTRIEQDGERSKRESDERLTRIEQLVESNNRFLETFTERVDRLAQKVDRLTDNTDRVI
jgi:ubiquinone biosynthesis protein UbiJ